MSRDLPCVYRAGSVGEADIVAAWLSEQGITAFVKDYTAVSLYGPIAMSPLGVEVCVVEANQAPQAAGLLKQHAAELAARKVGQEIASPVEVTCEACGTTTVFPCDQRGRVQSCPTCRAYLDVPMNPGR